jgi:serine protease Do
MRNASRLFVTFVAVAGCGMSLASNPPARESRRTPIVDVFERCRDAVVNVSTTRIMQMQGLGGGSPWDDLFDLGPPRLRDQRVQSIGSGVVVHEDGYIVTNAHVVAQASDIQVTFADKKNLPAEIVATDPEHDLAVIKVNAPAPLAHQKLGRSNDLMIGETVIAIGNPLGLQHTVTAGIVSALDRDLRIGKEDAYRGLIQTDAPINPGNSGGPLLNINGELIGINTAIRGDAQNIGFAIPVDRLWELLPELLDIELRERVHFGLQVAGQDADVLGVREGSPAEEAGLLTGDKIVKFNGAPVRDGIDYYVRLLAQKPESQVHLEVTRGAETLEKTVLLASIPLPDGAKLDHDLLGIELKTVPADVRREFDLPNRVGLMVASVVRRGPADQVKMIPTDLIARIQRTPVSSLKDVGLVLERMKPGDPVLVEGARVDTQVPFTWKVTLRTHAPR